MCRGFLKDFKKYFELILFKSHKDKSFFVSPEHRHEHEQLRTWAQNSKERNLNIRHRGWGMQEYRYPSMNGLILMYQNDLNTNYCLYRTKIKKCMHYEKWPYQIIHDQKTK